MMETRFDQLILVFEEFKKINGGTSLVDTFSEKFKNENDKLTAYKQLGKLQRIYKNLAIFKDILCKICKLQ